MGLAKATSADDAGLYLSAEIPSVLDRIDLHWHEGTATGAVLTTDSFEDGSVGRSHLAETVFSADEAGRGKMAYGYVEGRHLTSTLALKAGSMFPYAGTTEPSGWLLCNGQTVSRTTYAALFNVCGTVYGAGDGSTTFRLPDLRGYALVGLDEDDADFDTLAETRGSKTVTLTEAQMPAHTHTVSGGAHGHSTKVYSRPWLFVNPDNVLGTGNRNDSSSELAVPGSATGNHAHTLATVGGGVAHTNLQPGTCLNWLIKV
jgi:microcystin-dependent protein